MKLYYRTTLVFAVVVSVLAASFQASAAILSYQAFIDGLQETPPNASPGTGFGSFTYDTITNDLAYNIIFSGLVAPETAAHLHAAPPGVPGPIRVPLPLGSPKIGNATLSASQEVELLGNLFYVNIHSTAFPGGEIRGQMLPIPEPATITLAAMALTCVAIYGRRRRNRATQ